MHKLIESLDVQSLSSRHKFHLLRILFAADSRDDNIRIKIRDLIQLVLEGEEKLDQCSKILLKIFRGHLAEGDCLSDTIEELELNGETKSSIEFYSEAIELANNVRKL